MSNGAARVDSIDALKGFRVALIKFSEAANVAISDAESELSRTQTWLEHEQLSHWQGQIRKRTELLNRAKEQLRMKKVFKSHDGTTASAVEEEKAVMKATRALAEAQERLGNVNRHSRELHKEIILYKGQVQRFSTTVQSDIPVALSKLDNMVDALERYVASGGFDQAAATAEAAAAAFFQRMRELGMSRSEAKADDGAADDPRAKTPAEGDRLMALMTDATIDGWAAGDLPDWAKTRLAELPAERKPWEDADRIVVADGVGAADRVYLHRQDPVAPGDSGWYLGPADGTPAGWSSLKVNDLLALRPELRDILTLPAGFVVTLDTGSVGVVKNAKDEDQWAAPTDGDPAAPAEEVPATPTAGDAKPG